MSFGNGYQPQEYNQFVPEGDYFVRLGLPQDIERGGYRIRSIPVEYKGMPGYGPKNWDIFDAPTDPEKLQSWNEQRTRDADAFGVQRGDFNPVSWRGKTGWVHVGPDKQGYIKVKWSLLKPKATVSAAPAARPMQEGKDYPPVGQKPAAQGAPAGDDFTDDIPFNGRPIISANDGAESLEREAARIRP